MYYTWHSTDFNVTVFKTGFTTEYWNTGKPKHAAPEKKKNVFRYFSIHFFKTEFDELFHIITEVSEKRQLCNFSAISWWEQVSFQWNDDDICNRPTCLVGFL